LMPAVFYRRGCWFVIQFVLAAGSYAAVSCKARTTLFFAIWFRARTCNSRILINKIFV
jgi:hypothetical protein